ncbi:MAG: hypothetical protein JO320_19685, partial [Alphaproteobacteria bacterium]|nr:hypothetical protein [Alphaproteobacteria bacterium]
KEQLPGRLTAAMRLLFEMQMRPGLDRRGRQYTVDEFTLMFTTQVGPPNLPDEYLSYLRDSCVKRNLDRYEDLREPFSVNPNGRDVGAFFREDFDGAFKLAIPKSLSELAWERDWVIDSARGIEVFEFIRDWIAGTYCMLHMAMTVRRQAPPRERRGPGQTSPAAEAEHRKVINRIFTEQVVAVENVVVGSLKCDLEDDLLRLFEYRRRYYDPQPE